MSAKETVKRYVLFIVSLFFAALGVAVTKRGELGVSPISSVANVMSSRFEGLTLGTWLILWNVVLILGQILLLFGGRVVGTQEGTVATALLTGLVVKFFVRRLSRPLTAVLSA